MSNQTLFRSAGVAGLLAAILMAVSYATSDPSAGIPWYWALANSVVGIILSVGLYQLYRGHASSLSMAAAAISVLGYLLFVVAGWTQAVYPSPLVVAADIAIYILGLSLFSWLAYRTNEMPRWLAIVGFLAALAGVGSYLLMWSTGADVTDPASLPALLSAFFLAYLVGVLAWLIGTGVTLLRSKAGQPVTA